jgi:hypothetical protein
MHDDLLNGFQILSNDTVHQSKKSQNLDTLVTSKSEWGNVGSDRICGPSLTNVAVNLPVGRGFRVQGLSRSHGNWLCRWPRPAGLSYVVKMPHQTRLIWTPAIHKLAQEIPRNYPGNRGSRTHSWAQNSARTVGYCWVLEIWLVAYDKFLVDLVMKMWSTASSEI